MRKIVLVLAFASVAPAYAGNDDYACMRDGPQSRACEWVQLQNDRQNEYRREQQERGEELQRCRFGGCR